jgi:hypothetical protein
MKTTVDLPESLLRRAKHKGLGRIFCAGVNTIRVLADVEIGRI